MFKNMLRDFVVDVLKDLRADADVRFTTAPPVIVFNEDGSTETTFRATLITTPVDNG